MTSINPINVNTTGIGAAGYSAQAKTNKETKEEKTETQPQAEQKSVSPDSVFSYMAASANTVAASINAKSATSINPSKYVDAASQERIANLMNSFEDKVAEGLKAFDQEFQGVNVSDDAKMAVVLGKIDKETV